MQAFVRSTWGELQDLWARALEVWSQGGWAMIAIAVIAMVIFLVGTTMHIKLRRIGHHAVPERVWRQWIEHPFERRGRIGEVLDTVTKAESLKAMAFRFEQVRASEAVPFEHDLKVMKVCVSAAPLVGLLGTVTGMLSTFGALSSGAGGDQTMGLVAKGISEALITTETGLVVALPGLFFQHQLLRRIEGYKAFLAHLETVCTQAVYLRRGQEKNEAVRVAAARQIAARLSRRLGTQRADLAAAQRS